MTVRLKLRYVLPLVQMALAVALLWQSNLWFKEAVRLSDIPGPSPAFELCRSINAPIALFQALWFRYASSSADNIVFVLAVGALWYWVGVNFESWRRYRAVLVIRRKSLRLAIDLVLFAMGVLLAIVFMSEMRKVLPYFDPRSLWSLAIFGPYVLWSLVLMFFFGRDFIIGVREGKLNS
jgi:hypothetical protein